MKALFLSIFVFTAVSAHAFTITGVGYEGVAANCNIASNGSGTISNCSIASNQLFVCDCQPNVTPGRTCNTIVGIDYMGAQANCNIATNGRGHLENCAIAGNNSFVCGCCY